MKCFLSIILFTLVNTAMASGDSEHASGHVADLMFPAINFILLFGFIFLKARKPVSEMFTNNSLEVESLFNMAEEKSKEAQIKYDTYSKKLESLDSELSKILRSADEDAENFDKNQKSETQQTLERLKRDAANKIESEKNEMIRSLNASLLDEVISKAKNEINSNSEYKNKATKKLLSNIG